MERHILIVEDQTVAAKAICIWLSRLGCTTELATDGKTALEKLSKQDYDLIFMDLGLPDMTGLEVTKKIRALDNAKKADIPILGLTGRADDRSREKCLSAGMNDVLLKPPTVSLLKSKLEQWINVSAA